MPLLCLIAVIFSLQPAQGSEALNLAVRVENRVGLRLPPDVAALMRAHPIKFVITDQISRPELFEVNERGEMLIRVRPEVQVGADLDQILTHAYFHAVHYVLHPDEPAWVREGMAQEFEFLTLDELQGNYAEAGLRDVSTPLMGNYDVEHPNPAQYGHDGWYFNYLIAQCGGIDLFWRIARGTPGKWGAAGIDAALAGESASHPPIALLEQCSSFQSSATHFEVARIHNKIGEGPNADIHFLWLTSLPGPPSRDKVTLGDLRSLQLFQPVPLAPDAKLSESLPEGFLEFWVNSDYPFSVEQAKPKNIDSSWREIVVRVSERK